MNLDVKENFESGITRSSQTFRRVFRLLTLLSKQNISYDVSLPYAVRNKVDET